MLSIVRLLIAIFATSIFEPMQNVQGIETLHEYNGYSRPGFSTMSHSCNHVREVPDQFKDVNYMKPALTDFYQKYTEVYNIPVLSSAQVNDEALKRLCYMLRFILAGDSRVREEIYSWFGRFVVVGVNETTLDLPEYKNVIKADPATFERQDVGGSYYYPVTAVAESNLICLPSDRYPVLDLALHEVTHMVHDGGARFAVPGWNDRLHAAFDSARSNGLWINTYLNTNVNEYIAQGVCIYYNVVTHVDETDGINGPISNTAALKGYDPALYALIEDTYLCNNTFIRRCESDRVQENAQVFNMNCDLRQGITPIKFNENSDYDGLTRAGYATMSHTCGNIRSVPAELRTAANMYPGLNNFYQKYTEAYGIPILGSADVSDEALKRLCYLVRIMFASDNRVRELAYTWFTRFVALANDETPQDIPEYTASDASNEHINGSIYFFPVTAVYEKNLLCATDDSHSGRDVAVHQIAHMIEHVGALYAIPGWHDLLVSAFETAQAGGNTLSGADEYFALGVEEFYGDNTKRGALRTADPALYKVIDKVFSCDTQIIDRCDKDRASENAQEPRMNCNLRKPFTTDCYDSSSYCKVYKEGTTYCGSDGGQYYCIKTCNDC